MSVLWQARILVFLLSLGIGGVSVWFLSPAAAGGLRKLPRARLFGMLLSAICWVWVFLWLWWHPIDFLSFLTPARLVIALVVCIPLSWVLLQNLLCARALGGLFMLWPMPVILVVRDFETGWRLVPIVLGYVSLTFGMFVVFYPWIFRVGSEFLAEHTALRRGVAFGGLVLSGMLLIVALCLGKVVGA